MRLPELNPWRGTMIEKRCEGGRLLEIDNNHVTSCGDPPSLDATDKYVGYFENPHGEQWVFIGDGETGKAMIRGGDVGWETQYNVSLTDPCPNTILNDPEKVWIITCFMAICTLREGLHESGHQDPRRGPLHS